jgi:hypothetical protein
MAKKKPSSVETIRVPRVVITHETSALVQGRVVTYLRTLPVMIPSGKVLVHNFVRPRRRLGASGFRAWLADPDPRRYRTCACGWAPELGRHVTMRAYQPAKKKGRA